MFTVYGKVFDMVYSRKGCFRNWKNMKWSAVCWNGSEHFCVIEASKWELGMVTPRHNKHVCRCIQWGRVFEQVLLNWWWCWYRMMVSIGDLKNYCILHGPAYHSHTFCKITSMRPQIDRNTSSKISSLKHAAWLVSTTGVKFSCKMSRNSYQLPAWRLFHTNMVPWPGYRIRPPSSQKLQRLPVAEVIQNCRL